MRKHLSWILHLFIICVSLSLAGGPGEETPPVSEETDDNGWVYGRIEYEHDLIAPNLFFIELLAHPDGHVPMIEGGYASTDVHVIVRLRGVDVPRAMHAPEERHRPHLWRDRERERWNASLKYVWNLLEPTKTLRVHKMAVIDADRVIEANIEFWLGGAWHNLAVAMLNDDHARPEQTDGSTWDPGSKTWGLENPENPR